MASLKDSDCWFCAESGSGGENCEMLWGGCTDDVGSQNEHLAFWLLAAERGMVWGGVFSKLFALDETCRR